MMESNTEIQLQSDKIKHKDEIIDELRSKIDELDQ